MPSETEFWQLVEAAWKAHPEWRAGQAVFNTAALLHSGDGFFTIPNSIDPYYNDDNIGAFVKALGETIWN